VSGLSGAIAISAGDGYSLALLSNGTVKAWGNNEAAQLGTGSATGPEQCKVNEVFKVVVEEEGKKVEKEEVKAVEHDCSVTPVAVSALSGVTAISAGFAHNLALLETGEVKAWGYNSFGQLGNGSTTGPSKCTFGLNQVACATKPVAVSGLTGASAVAAGEQHSLAAKAGGGVVAWGSNEEGQLGDGTLNESDVPVAVTGLGQVSAVAAGTRTSMALLPSGAVMAWGSNYYGQVGDGTRTERLRPTMVCGLTGGSSIATRGGHSLAAITGTPACPAVTSISPTTGSGQGGTSVTITGSTLAEATEVHFGNSKATSFTVESATKIVAVSPPGSGVVHVTVTTPLGQSAPSAADLFTYQAPPNVTRVQPNTGPSAGGTPVTISGSAFNGASEVKFGATPAASFTVESANTIKAISPAHAAGTVDVTVKTQFGTSTSTAEDQFAFVQLEAPEFGRCLKVAVGTGAYATSNCTTTGGERKFEWNPGSGPHPLVKKKFTTSIKPTTLAKLTTTGAGEVMTCTGQTGHGEYTGARSVGGVGMTFTGCHRGELGKCQSPLAAEGEVATTTLQGELGVVTTSPEGPTKNKIGLDLKPASGETVAEFSCAGVPALVTGSVIVEIKANSMLSKVTLKYVGAKGVQKPSRFEGGEQDVLHTTLGEASPEGSVLTLATVQTNEEKVEINSVV
jgi:hypothetical protein